MANPSGPLGSLLAACLPKSGLPAIAAAVVRPEGIVEQAAVGLRAMGGTDTVTTDDPWHIGSCTKAMTATLYARLVDAGRARWGVSLTELFPDLTLAPGWHGVTIEHVLSHTSGLGDLGPTWVSERRADLASFSAQRLKTAQDALTRAPVGEVGRYAYTNLGYIIAGAAIERIAGEPWEEAIRRHVFAPLGMMSAGFGAPAGAAPVGHTVKRLSSLSPPSAGHAVPVGMIDNPPALGPAGTVHVTLQDWSRFVRVFIDPAQDFLTEASLDRLLAPPGDGHYALGWGLKDMPGLGRVHTHAGSNTFWVAQATLLRESRAAILVTTNGPRALAQEPVAAITKAMARAIVGI